ncbi:MAG: hypothetical protein RL380_1261 [Verrucomicrobiota bacterium]|jgi:hypothetical protein
MKLPLRQILTSLLVACAVGAVLHWTLLRLVRTDDSPAGFAQGLVQGALMPMSLPNLLAGDDIEIFAAHHTGRLYKLGYVLGVNACGALFFGYFFWRVRRIRRQLKLPSEK